MVAEVDFHIVLLQVGGEREMRERGREEERNGEKRDSRREVERERMKKGFYSRQNSY